MATTQSRLAILIQPRRLMPLQVHTEQDWQEFIEEQKQGQGEELEFFHDGAGNKREVELHVFNSLSKDDQDYIEYLDVLQYI